jgi:response regulator RpfG family c-di-GMP phosphodiesterase
MPGMDGMEVAEHILRINPKQRIVFASAYVKESLMEAVQRLKRIVEFMQKPFRLVSLVGAIEDRKICEELERLNAIISQVKDFNPAPEQIRELLDGLNRIQRGRDYLIDGIKRIEDTIKISCLAEQNNAT